MNIDAEKIIDIAIIGAGPAGMSAAIYGVRSGKKTVIFEAKSFGGQIINSSKIENYPGIESINGFDFAMKLYEQVTSLGVEIIYERVEDILEADTEIGGLKALKTSGGEYLTKAVIIATGTQKATLGLDNEKQLVGRGVSYCATCDGAFFKGKDVAVIGGGSTALEDALFLTNYCNRVYVIHRRDKFTGEDKYLEELKEKKNTELIMNSEVVNLIGTDTLTGIEIKDKTTNTVRTIELAGIFVAIGQNPQNQEWSGIVELNDRGYIVAGEECTTSKKGIFVAGDCRTKRVRQLTTAAADGAVAALAASTYASAIRI